MTRHLLVVGAQRCGTTFLHSVLDRHPEIAMARPARPEPKVFLSEEQSARGLDWYRSTYFAHARAERVLGEKSTSYLESPAAARRARDVLGDADVVVLLRDPVARAVSNWRFSTEHGSEDRPLATALRENLRGPRAWDHAATSVSPYAYLERGRYDDFLEPWCQAFPSSIHVLFLEELLADPDVLPGLHRALGVGPTCLRSAELDRVNESHVPAPDLDPDLTTEVDHYFAESDARLVGRLGRDLPWSRQPVGGRDG